MRNRTKRPAADPRSAIPANTSGSRRDFLFAAGGLAAGFVLGPAGAAAPGAGAQTGTALAMATAIGKLVGAAPVAKGRVKLALPPLVENGNAVALSVSVDSPMTESDHVTSIHVFNEKNPQPYVASFHLGPRAGRARVSTRIRLADSQTVVAICQMSDGSFWSDSAEVVVTLAACTEVL